MIGFVQEIVYFFPTAADQKDTDKVQGQSDIPGAEEMLLVGQASHDFRDPEKKGDPHQQQGASPQQLKDLRIIEFFHRRPHELLLIWRKNR